TPLCAYEILPKPFRATASIDPWPSSSPTSGSTRRIRRDRPCSRTARLPFCRFLSGSRGARRWCDFPTFLISTPTHLEHGGAGRCLPTLTSDRPPPPTAPTPRPPVAPTAAGL